MRLEDLEIREWVETSQVTLAQSAGAEEYTDCISAEEYPPPTSILDMALNNLIVRF